MIDPQTMAHMAQALEAIANRELPIEAWQVVELIGHLARIADTLHNIEANMRFGR